MIDGPVSSVDGRPRVARSFIRAGAAAWLAVLALTAACGGANPVGPSNQPEVGNSTDNFQFQASNLAGTTQTLTYTWTNTGAVANVNQSGRIESGDATLVLRDPSGNQVYSRSLKSTGTFTSSAGTPGSWRIEVVLAGVNGTLNFRVQRAN